jgi:diguanylate cyclase (GGDEF)-like protein/PAS domain S-box-containing protein
LGARDPAPLQASRKTSFVLRSTCVGGVPIPVGVSFATGFRWSRGGRGSGSAGLEGRLLEVVFEQSEVGVAVVDRELRFVRVNHAFGLFQDRDPSEIVGGAASEALPELAAEVEQAVLGVLATGEAVVGQEVVARDPDGPDKSRWFSVNGYPLFSADGSVEAVVSMFVEVSGLKRAQVELDAALEGAKETHRSELASRRAQLEALGRYRTIFEGASVGILRVAADGRMVEANPAMEKMLGYGAAELAEIDMRHYTHADDVDHNLALFRELMAGERDSYQLEKRCYCKDGSLVWVQVTAALERDAQGNPQFAISMLEDITARKDAEDALLREEERLAALIRHSADAIFVVGEDCRIRFASPAATTLLESGGETQLGRSLLDSFVAASRQSIVRQLANLTAMPTAATVPLEAHLRTARGQARAVEGTACNLLGDSSIDGIVVTLRDVSVRAELEEQLTRRALHDDLTGLPNRALFADRLAHALDRAAREPQVQTAVLFVDLDDFKAVNDGMGHSAGDELIRGVAARIRAGLRPGDTVARLGGDEFAVLVDRVPSLEYANDVAQRILELLSLPIDVAGVSLAVPASVGVTLAGRGSDVESLLQDADIAMYTAKSKGKGRIEVFDETLRDIASQRLALKIDLPEALRLDQFRLDYQPIQRVSDHEIIGFEALIRWHHPSRGIVPPAEFIPAAEQSGLIVEIGRWVLEQACQQAAAWNRDRPQPLSISVNVSAVQLHSPGFNDLLRNVLETSGLPAPLLTIELTESVLVDSERVMRILEQLSTIGVKIAIDDFGTGYSSLSYLQKFPVTSVKVDRSFVAELTNGDPGLVRSIVSLAEVLGLTTVAEGVETADQLKALDALNCSLSQGFYIGYPQTADKIDALLRCCPSELTG